MNGEYDYPRKGLVFTHEFLIDRDWVEEPWTVVSMEIMYNKYIQILTIKYDKDETVYTNGDYDGYDIYTDLSLSQRYSEHSTPPLTTVTPA